MTDFQQDVIDRLARIETHLENFTEHNADHETRVRSLERKHWALSGAIGAVTAVIGWLGYHITLH